MKTHTFHVTELGACACMLAAFTDHQGMVTVDTARYYPELSAVHLERLGSHPLPAVRAAAATETARRVKARLTAMGYDTDKTLQQPLGVRHVL